MNSIYLDYAATAPVSNYVANKLKYSFKWHNPNSYYYDGQIAKREIEDVRLIVAQMIGADPDEIIFTSGGSESNAMAVDGILSANPEYRYCVCSEIEHSSILENPLSYPIIRCDRDGIVLLEDIPDEKAFVSVMLVNNEIGTIQPIKSIAKIVHAHDGLLMVDAVQAFGKVSINVKELDADIMTFSGHKVGALKGVGFLYVKRGTPLNGIIYGTQENGFRGGTYNHLGIMSLRYAIEETFPIHKNIVKMKSKRDYLLSLLLDDGRFILNGSAANRCCSNINVCIPSLVITGQQLAALLDMQGIQISAGSACHAGDETPSHVLTAIGLSPEQASKSIRISIGKDTTLEELDTLYSALLETINFESL